ncbi:hypothetical protein [Planctobacterium marinum]|uniref:Uncharacterized protein n=1 Tax=Planctobacterium marinum TaxID=1631968 RepID=A0AA48KPZ2_9ALTE|nr:hypothetical protein MACH26_00530 [Planctobacterium marinum]
MLRLSHRAWNNVVILAMLFMVYLFTLSNDMINSDEDTPEELMPLFPPFSVIMTLDFGIARIERIGQDWRIQDNAEAPLNDLVQISENWRTLEVRPAAITPEQSPYIVSVLLAGEDKKRVFQLFPEESGLILHSSGQNYQVDNIAIESLFPIALVD